MLAMQGSVEKAAGPEAVPEWMSCDDLVVYRVLQDTSTQIANSCKAFGERLQGVCGSAKNQLPRDDSFNTFLTAFGSLSMALLQLSTDLEASMNVPLKGLIDTLQEETQGHYKHWRHLRSRLAELQDRYCRSHEAANKAKGRLANADDSQRSWFKRKGDDKDAAMEQHAAMCDLAKCEEELRESEACLQKLESESRERLQQLGNEKRAVLKGALTKGASSLRRLMVVADKAPEPQEIGGPQADHSEWRGIVPGEDCMGGPRNGDASASSCPAPCEGSSLGSDAAHDSDLSFSADGVLSPQGAVKAAAATLASPATPQPQQSESKRAESSTGGGVDGAAAKYVHDGGLPTSCKDLGLTDLSDDEPELDATSRATTWTPTKSPPVVRTPASRRSLVFQSATNPLTLRRDSEDGSGSRGGPQSAEGRWAADVLRSSESGTASATLDPFALSKSESFRQAAGTGSRAPVAVVEDDDDEDDDFLDKAIAAAARRPLAQAEVKLDITPLTSEFPQKCFERYVQRLPSRLATASETSWSKLQTRASEQILGGHLGKLELFWIHRPDVEATPEMADGLVAFQFVQGFAANFVRILHLSVVGSPVEESPGLSPQKDKGVETDWPTLMPSAIFEVRRLLFATLPVASLRAVVFAGEDDNGRIYVDRDVEVSFERCRFRWFQLTQSLRRTRSVLRKEKVKPSARFLVLHAARGELDPPPPRRASIAAMPALKLRDEQPPSPTKSPSQLPAKASSAPMGMGSFSNI